MNNVTVLVLCFDTNVVFELFDPIVAGFPKKTVLGGIQNYAVYLDMVMEYMQSRVMPVD